MYKIGGLLFCLMTGFLVAHYGWIAFLWATLGFVPGIFIAANMVLPILMGVPIATLLILKKQMRATVYFALLRAPIFWFIALFLFGWFFPNAATWIYNNEPLNIAANLSLLLILLSPLSKKARQDFRDDFDKSYGRYYTEQNNFTLNFTDLSDKKQLKQIEAAIQVSSNLYLHTTSTSSDSFKFRLPDSRFRYMLFCLTATVKSCEDLINASDSLLKEQLHFLANITTAKESTQEYFSGQMKPEEAEHKGSVYLNGFLKQWTIYLDYINSGDKDNAAETISAMIHSTETDETINTTDKQRLKQLTWEIEQSIPSMRYAFTELLKK